MKEPREVMDMLTKQLLEELVMHRNDEEHEVDIKLANSYSSMYFSLVKSGYEVIEEYSNAMDALNNYAFKEASAGHAAYTTLLVKMTSTAERIDALNKVSKSSVSNLTTEQLQLALFGDGPI